MTLVDDDVTIRDILAQVRRIAVIGLSPDPERPSHGVAKAMIEAGAGGVHFEDQLASEKKCGHLGGKVLVPTSQFIRTLSAARCGIRALRRRGTCRMWRYHCSCSTSRQSSLSMIR